MCLFCINCYISHLLHASAIPLPPPIPSHGTVFQLPTAIFPQNPPQSRNPHKKNPQTSLDCREAPCGWGSEIHSLYDSLLSSQTLWSELVIWGAFPLCLSGLLWSFAPVAKGSVLCVWFGGYGTPFRLFERLSLFTLPSCFQLNPPSFSPTSLLLSFPSPIRVDCEGKEGGGWS